MTDQEDIQFEADVEIVDAAELENIKKKEEKIDRIMWLIKENWLDQDKEFMDAIVDAFEGIERDI